MTAVELRLLGPLQLGPMDGRVPLGGPKQRAVLARLALGVGQAVPADELIELLWPDGVGPAQPRRTLQVYIANLRKLLRVQALDIAGSGAGYRLVAARDAVDITVFEDLVAEAGQLADDHPVDALALHEAARELWRGRALSDLVIEIAGLERDALRLDEQRVHAAEQRLGLAVRYGDRTAAVVELEAMIAAEPWREQAIAHLMVGLYGLGRQADALAVGAAARARLVDELGLDPSPVLRDVEQQILEQRLPLPERRADVVADGGRRLRNRLPAMLTRFVGRTEELARLANGGDASRLRTVVGTGGVGKTRLALEAAHRCPHPAVFVPLSATDASGVARATITATGLPIGPAATAAELAEVFVAELGDRPAWLVLDNAEHVLDATARLVTELLRAVPTLTVIVTSREPLAIPGEAVFSIAPMQLVDASALFADRAGGAGCRLDMDDDEVRRQVDQLCAAVDGLPLAIEMAANRLRVFQLPELVERMDDRDALLRSPVRSELSTRGTMLATIDWSHSLLLPAERAMFARLAMFPEGCAATAAEAVCHVDGDDFEVEEVVDLVARLVDRSLVVADHTTSPTRFRMLDTIRHFAAERLADRPDVVPVEDAYIEWATNLAVGAAAGLRTAEQGMWRTTVEAELDNLRVAFDRAVAAGRVEALHMTNALSELRLTRGEIVLSAQWLRRALDATEGSGWDVPRAVATIEAARLGIMIGGDDRAIDVVDAALDELRRAGAIPELAEALTISGRTLMYIGDVERGLASVEEAVQLLSAAGDDAALARAWGVESIGIARTGRFDEAAVVAERALETSLALGDEVGAMPAMRAVMTITWRRGQLQLLRARAEQAKAIEERHDLGLFLALGRYWLAAIAVVEGNTTSALAQVDAVLRRRGWSAVHQALQALRSLVLRRTGDAEQAWQELMEILPPGTKVLGAQSVTGIVERGWCELELGRLEDAGHSFEEAARAVWAADDPQFVAASLEGRAAVALAVDARDEARRLLAEADVLRREGPAILNLHGVEVDRLRRALASSHR